MERERQREREADRNRSGRVKEMERGVGERE